MAARIQYSIGEQSDCGVITGILAPASEKDRAIRVKFVCAHCKTPHTAYGYRFRAGRLAQSCKRTEQCRDYWTKKSSALDPSTRLAIFVTTELAGRATACTQHHMSKLSVDFAWRQHIKLLLARVPVAIQNKLHDLAHSKSGVHFEALASGTLGRAFGLCTAEIKAIVRRVHQRLGVAVAVEAIQAIAAGGSLVRVDAPTANPAPASFLTLGQIAMRRYSLSPRRGSKRQS